MLRRLCCFLLIAPALGQQPPATKPAPPQVRINVLEVCRPDPETQRALSAALARLSAEAAFDTDFEVARGRTTIPDSPVSDWVRIRREFRAPAPAAGVQYSFSTDTAGVVETLVFRMRESDELMQVSIEDRLPGASIATALAGDMPATRVAAERLGKQPYVLARCRDADQTAYEPLFTRASKLLARYRKSLAVRRTVPGELGRLSASASRSGDVVRSPSTARPAGLHKPKG